MRQCRCTPDTIARYQGRLSGPLLDRIDLQVEVPAVPPEQLAAASDGERSDIVAERVLRARERALTRQGFANARLESTALDEHARLDAATSRFAQGAAVRLGWSARAFHRMLRVARTVADLGAADAIGTPHVAEAMQYRRVLAVA